MRRRTLSLALSALYLWTYQIAAASNGLCEPLRRFVASIKPNDTRVLEFHTSWGSGFKNSDDESTIAAKRCDPNGYEPAKAVCAYLMEYGATEFSGNNAKAAVTCLSRKTYFGDRLLLDGIELSLTYGTDDRGSNVDIKFSGDDQLGGMVLSITARGY
jgi:hypothetical protein